MSASNLEELSLGAAPSEEECEQVGPNYDVARARAECRAYRDQIVREFGKPPASARFVVRSCPHDLGTYLDLVIAFNAGDLIAADYAWACEERAPGEWDAVARVQLGLPESADAHVPERGELLPVVHTDGLDHCPTCGRTCGERDYWLDASGPDDVCYQVAQRRESCTDDFHRAADRAPELLRALRDLSRDAAGSGWASFDRAQHLLSDLRAAL
ncbi:MAG: hypothetical protein KGK07_16350 [Chloroflexota bacterium]|nr:hypothetical protein [Chloroflexota bacterium]